MPNRPYAEVRRLLAAAPERVFAAFADAGLVARWLTPSPEIRLTVLQFDFREGGAYRFAYHVPDGSTVVVTGFFSRIERPSRIVFSWLIEPPDPHAGVDSEVTVTIAPEGDFTALVIRHEKFTATDAVLRHQDGWQGAVAQLAPLLAQESAHGG